MKATIFTKKYTSKDGRDFNIYFGKMVKGGEEISVNFKFREDCGNPKPLECPMNIVFNKEDANYSEKVETYTDSEGNIKEALKRTIWIKTWEKGEPYVDNSLEDFE